MKFKFFVPRAYQLETLSSVFSDLCVGWFFLAVATAGTLPYLILNLFYSTVCLLVALYLNREKENYD